MSVPERLATLAGPWTGTSRLWLAPGQPARESASAAWVALAANRQFLTLQYTWANERAQEGLLLFGADAEGKVAAAWTDSWHMSDKLMSCEGRLAPDGSVSVSGRYAAPPGPDWGWRIAIEPQDQRAFRFTMFNVPPDAGEQLAVEAVYTRAD